MRKSAFDERVVFHTILSQYYQIFTARILPNKNPNKEVDCLNYERAALAQLLLKRLYNLSKLKTSFLQMSVLCVKYPIKIEKITILKFKI